MKLFFIALTASLLFFNLSPALAAEGPYEYPLRSCLSCGDALGENVVTLVHAGRELKFCCIECVAPYAKSPETYTSSLVEQIKATQRDTYPLKTCVISGHELGSMGDPVEYVHGNTLVKFCCSACIETFEKESEKHLKTIEEARKK